MAGHDPSEFMDERREWLRVDDCLLLEYHLRGEPREAALHQSEVPDAEAITTFIAKPTQDLMAAHQSNEPESLLIPWLKKIDWVLEIVLQQLIRVSREGVALPRLTAVNISGGGISFPTSRCFQIGDHLDLRFILPPFTPIQAQVEVTRVAPSAGDVDRQRWSVGTRFIRIGQDDHERLIRHILHVQAERLRARHLSTGVPEL